MTGSIDDLAFIKPSEMLSVRIFLPRGVDPIISTLQDEAGHTDTWLFRKPGLDIFICGIPGDAAKTMRYECSTTSTKSGLSKDGAVSAQVASSNRQVGDQIDQICLQISRLFNVKPARPRSVWK